VRALDHARLLERPPVVFDEEIVRARFDGAAVMVTGAGGSIGSALLDLLGSMGAAELVCVEHHEPSLHRLGLRLSEKFPERRVRLALADVRDADRLGRLIDAHQIDALFHLAAYKHVPLAEQNCDQVAEVNVLSTLALADRAAALGVRDVVYPSTDKAVRPPSIYGVTKRLVELELLRRANQQGRRCAVARLVNVFGTSGNVIERWSDQLPSGQPISVTDPRMTRYWMTTREATMLLASAACLDRAPAPLLVEVGQAVPLLRTAERLAELLIGRTPEVRIVGLRPGERLHEELHYDYEVLEPSVLPGIVQASALRPLDDATATVSELECAVAAGDDRWVRRILGGVMAANAVAT
jgi:FlaA1/EpsC-like NDP-sugar epimerase